MDPAVVAALISSPVALLAATAAYGAGRVQGRGAYRGPVDAVRRQHQRDAYADLLTAANSYMRQTMWAECSVQACAQLGISYPPGERRDEAGRRACRIQADVSPEPLRLAAAVVHLEGPEHIAEIAHRIENHAHSVHVSALRGEIPNTMFDMLEGRPQSERHNHNMDLINAIYAFTEAARAHLNDDKRPPG